jgi:hypothetical protein
LQQDLVLAHEALKESPLRRPVERLLFLGRGILSSPPLSQQAIDLIKPLLVQTRAVLGCLHCCFMARLATDAHLGSLYLSPQFREHGLHLNLCLTLLPLFALSLGRTSLGKLGFELSDLLLKLVDRSDISRDVSVNIDDILADFCSDVLCLIGVLEGVVCLFVVTRARAHTDNHDCLAIAAQTEFE